MLERLPSDQLMQTWLLIGIAVLLVVVVIAGPEFLRSVPAKVAGYSVRRLRRSHRGLRGRASQNNDLKR